MLPKAIALVGGPHVSATGTSVLADIPEADYAFVGEAEIGLPLLMRSLLGGEKIAREDIPGLVGGVTTVPPQTHALCGGFGLARISGMGPHAPKHLSGSSSRGLLQAVPYRSNGYFQRVSVPLRILWIAGEHGQEDEIPQSVQCLF